MVIPLSLIVKLVLERGKKAWEVRIKWGAAIWTEIENRHQETNLTVGLVLIAIHLKTSKPGSELAIDFKDQKALSCCFVLITRMRRIFDASTCLICQGAHMTCPIVSHIWARLC